MCVSVCVLIPVFAALYAVKVRTHPLLRRKSRFQLIPSWYFRTWIWSNHKLWPENIWKAHRQTSKFLGLIFLHFYTGLSIPFLKGTWGVRSAFLHIPWCSGTDSGCCSSIWTVGAVFQGTTDGPMLKEDESLQIWFFTLPWKCSLVFIFFFLWFAYGN